MTDHPPPGDPDVERLARSPHRVPLGVGSPADELLKLACLNYGTDTPAGPPAARRLLDEQPGLSGASTFTAAACGDRDAAAALLALDPVAANRAGGPFDWPPLLYLAYSRLGAGDAVATARLLLDHGADPNAGYLWEGLVPPFPALTGAYGGGERCQPPHPDERRLAELLLEGGADPNDHQTVYNRGLGSPPSDDTGWLEQLLGHGLGRGDGGPWKRRLGGSLPGPAALLGEALQTAVEHGTVERVRLLLRHGADPNGRGVHPVFAGHTALEGARRRGDQRIVDLLVAAGAAP